MDIITIIALLMAIIGIAIFLYNTLTGKLDKRDLVGMILIVFGVVGLILIHNIIGYYLAIIQTNYDIAKDFIESLNTSESVKQTALSNIQQINESGQKSLYNLKLIYSTIFVCLVFLGLILLIKKHLMPKESNETFRKEGA